MRIPRRWLGVVGLGLATVAAWVGWLHVRSAVDTAAPDAAAPVAPSAHEPTEAPASARPAADSPPDVSRGARPSLSAPNGGAASLANATGADAAWTRLPPEYWPDPIAQDIQENLDQCPGFKDYYVGLDCSTAPCALVLRGLMVSSVSSVTCAQVQNTPVRFSLAAPGQEAASRTVYFFEPSDEVFDSSALRARGVALLHDPPR